MCKRKAKLRLLLTLVLTFSMALPVAASAAEEETVEFKTNAAYMTWLFKEYGDSDVLRGTDNDAYRERLEEEYGFEIEIYDNVLDKSPTEGFYRGADYADAELRTLQNIDAAFSQLPPLFVREVTSKYERKGMTPKICAFNRPNTSVLGVTMCQSNEGEAVIYLHNGVSFMETLLHEFGHFVHFGLDRSVRDRLEAEFTEINGKYPYSEDYQWENELDTDAFRYFLRSYGAVNIGEDFSDLFAIGTLQYRYLASFSGGEVTPLHQKIQAMRDALDKAYDCIDGDSPFLQRCMPSPVSADLQAAMQPFRESGALPWGTDGLNEDAITKYDMALILQPFLYWVLDEDELLNKAGMTPGVKPPQDFVCDVYDSEDVELLHKLSILTVDDEGRFNPGVPLTQKEVADIFEKVCGLLDIHEDATDKLLSDHKPQFQDYSMTQWAAYKDVYGYLADLYELVEARGGSLPDKTAYYPVINGGTALGGDGWMYYDGEGLRTGKLNAAGYQMGVFEGRGTFAYPGAQPLTYDFERGVFFVDTAYSESDQVFYFPEPGTAVWANIPDDAQFNWLYMDVRAIEPSGLAKNVHADFIQNDGKGSMAFALPDVADGMYRISFGATAELLQDPYERMETALIRVSGGEYAFAGL